MNCSKASSGLWNE